MLRSLSKTYTKWWFALSHRSCIARTALAVLLTISQPSIDFGSSHLGASSFRVVRMLNSSAAQPAVIQRIEVGPPFGIAANSCLGQLDPSVNCTIAIFFLPPGKGDYKGRLLGDVLGKKAPLEVSLPGRPTSRSAIRRSYRRNCWATEALVKQRARRYPSDWSYSLHSNLWEYSLPG